MAARELPAEPDLTPREASRLSGCSYWTVLAEIKRGKLRAYRRTGDRIAIRHDDFCAWAYGDEIAPTERDQLDAPRPARRRRAAARGSVSPLKQLELRGRGAA